MEKEIKEKEKEEQREKENKELNELIKEDGRNKMTVKRIMQHIEELKESEKRIIEGQKKIQEEQTKFRKGQKEIISLLKTIKDCLKNISLENIVQEFEEENELELNLEKT